MVTLEKLVDKLTIELGNMLANNLTLGLQVDDAVEQLAESEAKLLNIADRNIELQKRVDKDLGIIAALRSDLDKAGVRAKVVLVEPVLVAPVIKVKRKR